MLVVKTTRATRTPSRQEPAQEATSPARVMHTFMGKPGFLLARINQIYAALTAGMGGGETPTQAEALLLLGAAGRRDQVSLARALGVDTSTMALVLTNLEARGVIAREADPEDRRRMALRLTPAGRRQLAGVRRAFLEVQSRLIQPLGVTEERSLKQMLRRIGTNPTSPAQPWVPEEGAPDSAAGIVTDAAGLLCRRALQVSEAYFINCTAALSLTPRQFSALFIARGCPELSQAEFSRIFGLDPATAGLIMKNLAARGLLDRKVSSVDRRARLHSLTAAGLKLIEDAQPLVDRSENLVLHDLSRAETVKLVSLLQEIVAAHREQLTFP